MAYTRVRQDHIWTVGAGIDDTKTPTNHDGAAVSLWDTIDYMCSQIADISGETTWETAPDLSIATMAARTWLSDVRRIRGRWFIHDIVVPSAVAASGSITTIVGSLLSDTETFTLSDGVNAAVTFEFDSNSTVTPGNVAVPFVGTETANDIRDLIITAINGATSFNITASSGGAATVQLDNDSNGSFGNTTSSELVSNVGFVVTNMTGGAGDAVILSVAGSDVAAGRNISFNTTTSGLVCAHLATGPGIAALTEVTGDNALAPDNICMIIDATTGDPVTSSARKIYALLQAEYDAVNGSAPDDTTNQLQLTFVRPNAAFDDLELVPTDDIAGKSIMYSYPDREYLHLWSQSDFRREFNVVDLSASAISVTLDTAYDGGSQVAVDNTDVDWRITDTKHFYVSDSTGAARILDVAAAVAGDTVGVTAPGGITLVGNVTGSTYNATWNGVQIGGTAGKVSTASGDLILSGADDINFVTTRQASLPLDDVTAGSISGLAGGPHASVAAAIKYAIEHGKFLLGVYVASGNFARGANIPGGAGGLNIASPHSIDMNTPSGVDTLIVWNGAIKLGGNGTTKNDVYAGTTPANGDIMVDEPGGVRVNDVILALQFATT